MSVPGVYVLHGVNFPGGQFLSQVEDATPSANLQELIGRASGHPDPLFTAISGSRVDNPFRTTQIKTILDLCGAPFAADLSGGNTDLYYKKATDLGVRVADATTSHKRFRMARGMVYWQDISASQDGNAVLSGRILPTYDGSNLPLVPAGSLALAGTPTAAEFFTLGPVTVNTVALTGLKSWRLSLGCTPFEEGADGELYTTFAGIAERTPVLELEGFDPTWWATYGLTGTALSALTFALRRRDADGGLYANGSSQHIVFTATNGKILPVDTSGSGNAPSRTKLRILLRPSSASAAVLAINTATTIS